MLKTFRLLSFVEGLSLITLLFIAMPAKYQFGINFVWPVGMAHGLLWMAFVSMSLIVSHRKNWSVLVWIMALACSVIPFGFVWLDRKLKAPASPSTAPQSE